MTSENLEIPGKLLILGMFEIPGKTESPGMLEHPVTLLSLGSF